MLQHRVAYTCVQNVFFRWHLFHKTCDDCFVREPLGVIEAEDFKLLRLLPSLPC